MTVAGKRRYSSDGTVTEEEKQASKKLMSAIRKANSSDRNIDKLSVALDKYFPDQNLDDIEYKTDARRSKVTAFTMIAPQVVNKYSSKTVSDIARKSNASKIKDGKDAVDKTMDEVLPGISYQDLEDLIALGLWV